MPHTSPTARALRTLEILQTRPGTTATELGERLGVTERAARRYVEILREAGIPVKSTRGRYGGYRLGRGARLTPIVFTEPEAIGLVMAVLDGQVTPDGSLMGAALDKLIRALPTEVGRQAAALRELTSAAPDQRSARPDPATLSALIAAIASRQRIRVSYVSEAGNHSELEIDPWAVVIRYGRWYLLCYSHRAQAVGTYRVDRVGSVTQTVETFEPPEDLDAVVTLERHLGTGWEFPTRVVFEAPCAEVLPWISPPMGILEPLGDRCVLIGSTSNPAMYARDWLSGLPFQFQIEGGPELRAAATELADRFAEMVFADPPTE